jgi:hypothetical protein
VDKISVQVAEKELSQILVFGFMPKDETLLKTGPELRISPPKKYAHLGRSEPTPLTRLR